jgi:hypothetical protein
MRHHAIIVTSYCSDCASKAHEKAVEIFSARQVTEILPEAINGYQTFFIGPDGSKEGWADSNKGNDRRDTFIQWLDEQRFSDNSFAYDWAEIQYGDDEFDNRMTRHDAQE